MTMLEQLRRAPRWLILLVGVAALAVTTAALVPHDDGEDRTCLVCKAGHKPLTELSSALVIEPPLETHSAAPVHQVLHHGNAYTESRPSRAPPA